MREREREEFFFTLILLMMFPLELELELLFTLCNSNVKQNLHYFNNNDGSILKKKIKKKVQRNVIPVEEMKNKKKHSKLTDTHTQDQSHHSVCVTKQNSGERERERNEINLCF